MDNYYNELRIIIKIEILIYKFLHTAVPIRYDLPKELQINKILFLLMMTYIDERSHLISLFLINIVIYYVDDKPYYTLDITPIPEITDFQNYNHPTGFIT